ncbi:MAG: hypothetical protein ACUVQP_11340 [Bacteroidales bacterium]
MKKLFAISLIVLAGAIMFKSCKKDESKPAPTISVTNNKTTYSITATSDTTIAFNVSISAEAGIDQFTIKKTVGSTTTSYGNPTGFAGQTSYTYHFEETFKPDMEYPISFTFKVVDKESQEASITVTIKKNQGSTNTPFATEYTDGVFYHIAGQLQGAYNLDGHALVPFNGDETTKSMKNIDAAGSPFTGSWTSGIGNGTEYVKTNTAYDNIYQENVAALYAAGTPSTTVTNPQNNDVYIGKKGTKYYVIQILSVEPNYNQNTGGNKGRITFKYKM